MPSGRTGLQTEKGSPTLTRTHTFMWLGQTGAIPESLNAAAHGSGASLLTKYPASWSPNGKWLAFDLGWSDVAYAIAVTKVDGRGMHVVRHGSPTGKPAWSPNGMKIAFETGR